MRPKVYIEASVISYLNARAGGNAVAAGRQRILREMWPVLVSEYDLFVGPRATAGGSTRAAPLIGLQTLPLEASSRTLAERLTATGAIPHEHQEAALDMAVAVIHNMDILLTWNYAAINNASSIERLRDAVRKYGLKCPAITSPDALYAEVMGDPVADGERRVPDAQTGKPRYEVYPICGDPPNEKPDSRRPEPTTEANHSCQGNGDLAPE